jgi:hypothetical protein
MEIDHDNTPDLTYLHFEEIQIYGAPVGVTRVYCDGKDLNYTSQVSYQLIFHIRVFLCLSITKYHKHVSKHLIIFKNVQRVIAQLDRTSLQKQKYLPVSLKDIATI